VLFGLWCQRRERLGLEVGLELVLLVGRRLLLESLLVLLLLERRLLRLRWLLFGNVSLLFMDMKRVCK
jgi:hypothetical protein